MKTISKSLSEYNRIFRENDELYRDLAKRCGLSDAAFWILYVLRADSDGITQSEICAALYLPKQTVNSALKKMEFDGVIELTQQNNARSKSISLTEKGLALAERTVDRVIAAEEAAFSAMSEEERARMLALFRRYTDHLSLNFDSLDFVF